MRTESTREMPRADWPRALFKVTCVITGNGFTCYLMPKVRLLSLKNIVPDEHIFISI
jgi:hypothetical protein